MQDQKPAQRGQGLKQDGDGAAKVVTALTLSDSDTRRSCNGTSEDGAKSHDAGPSRTKPTSRTCSQASLPAARQGRDRNVFAKIFPSHMV